MKSVLDRVANEALLTRTYACSPAILPWWLMWNCVDWTAPILCLCVMETSSRTQSQRRRMYEPQTFLAVQLELILILICTQIYYCSIFYNEVATNRLCSDTSVNTRNIRGGTTLHEVRQILSYLAPNWHCEYPSSSLLTQPLELSMWCMVVPMTSISRRTTL